MYLTFQYTNEIILIKVLHLDLQKHLILEKVS